MRVRCQVTKTDPLDQLRYDPFGIDHGFKYVATHMAVVECIGRTLLPPAGVAIQLLSMDDAMVPLLHQEWVEIETLLESIGKLGGREVSGWCRQKSYAR